MDNYIVNTDKSYNYHFECHHFRIIDGILHAYDDCDEVIWVIKDWVSFRRITDEELTPKNPDDFYESINQEEKNGMD